jgi:hypothetical protein
MRVILVSLQGFDPRHRAQYQDFCMRIGNRRETSDDIGGLAHGNLDGIMRSHYSALALGCGAAKLI